MKKEQRKRGKEWREIVDAYKALESEAIRELKEEEEHSPVAEDMFVEDPEEVAKEHNALLNLCKQ